MKKTMKHLQSFLLIAFTTIVCTAFGQKNVPCCIDFNKSTTFPPGTSYKNPNDSITSFCWYESRTDKLVINGNTYYSSGRLVQAPASFGAGQVFNTNNITLKLTAIGTAKSVTITFDYLDMGGTENLSVNGKLYSGELDKAPANFGNATVTVTATPIPLPAKGKTGTVTINGIIKEFKIGGQEFYVDNICIVNNLKEKIPVGQ
jgi:hypothetical protein